MSVGTNHLTIVLAAPLTASFEPLHLGEPLLGGRISALSEGNAIDKQELLEDLRATFEREFDQFGELTTENLRAALFLAHTHRICAPLLQRASQLLQLAATKGITAQASDGTETDVARRCRELSLVLPAMTDTKRPKQPIAEALARGKTVHETELSMPDPAEHTEKLPCMRARLVSADLEKRQVKLRVVGPTLAAAETWECSINRRLGHD